MMQFVSDIGQDGLPNALAVGLADAGSTSTTRIASFNVPPGGLSAAT